MESTEKILFIGSFGIKSKSIVGGQTFACRQIIENEFLKTKYKFLIVDNENSKKTSKFLFSYKFKNVLLRFFTILFYILFHRFKFVIIFTSESFAFYEKGFYALFLNLIGKKIIFSPRSGLMIEWLEKKNNLFFAKMVFSSSHIILCQGEFWRQFYLKKIPLQDNKLHVLSNFININNDFRVTKKPISSYIEIIYLGWLHEKKGVLKLLQFVNYARNTLQIRLKVCGEGDMEIICRNYCQENDMNEIVQFLGWVEGDQKEKLLQDSHFIFLLSDTEGLPNSILEGMKYGNIPIVTNVGSLSEIINSKNGLVIDSINYEQIIAYLMLFYNNYDYYKKVSELNQRLIIEKYSNFSFERSINKVLQY